MVVIALEFLAISITLDRYEVALEIDVDKTEQKLRSIRPQFMENSVSCSLLKYCFWFFSIYCLLHVYMYAYIVSLLPRLFSPLPAHFSSLPGVLPGLNRSQ